ncbi:MAG: sulfite exporter TauE/SafE family protein [Acidobacteria bacterium]|nr:sulfite exporter TauE/SafE family protein [Acidobacteriota bacterium]
MIYLFPGLLFFAIATLYTAVGFGGGSSYIAILALSDLPYQKIPIIALACNISAVTINIFFRQTGQLIDWPKALTLAALAIPFGFIGGLTPLREAVFYLLLGLLLFASSWTLILPSSLRIQYIQIPRWLVYAVSPLLGLTAGLVGIGGGIFLAPVLYHSDYQNKQTVPATLSIYILGNSLFGLVGQISKAGGHPAVDYGTGLLLVAVLLGALTGNQISIQWLQPGRLRRMTGIVILLASIRILFKSAGI